MAAEGGRSLNWDELGDQLLAHVIAMGFTHPEPVIAEQLGATLDVRGNIAASDYATSVDKLFVAGDARRGQSLIVWAINEGRQCARAVDRHLAALPV